MAQLIEENIWFAVLMLLIGFVFLVKGADLFVDGSSSVAKRLKVPSIIIGLTIVAMGTSLPETAVSVTASLADNNTLAVSNVIGSNIFNSMVVVGVCAVMTPIAVNPDTLRRDIPFSVFCALLLLVLGSIGMTVGHLDGVILLLLFIGFLVNMVRLALRSRKDTGVGTDNSKMISEDIERKDVPENDRKLSASENAKKKKEDDRAALPVWRSLFYIVLGAVGIALGGDWVVDSASSIAVAVGMSQTLVGLTIVSVGTSLPELVTSVVAAHKKEVDMALGNAFGSNVFNILMVLGIASAISPIAFITENMIDIIILIAMSIMIWIFAGTKKRITREEGLIMVLVYAIYVAYIIIR